MTENLDRLEVLRRSMRHAKTALIIGALALALSVTLLFSRLMSSFDVPVASIMIVTHAMIAASLCFSLRSLLLTRKSARAARCQTS